MEIEPVGYWMYHSRHLHPAVALTTQGRDAVAICTPSLVAHNESIVAAVHRTLLCDACVFNIYQQIVLKCGV